MPEFSSVQFRSCIIPSNEHPGLISFRMDWLGLLAVQGTLKSLLQHYSSKALILQCSAFFTVQLSQPYMTTGKTIALTRRTFVGKVMSLLLNMLSRLVITFLPRSKRFLISWLQKTLCAEKKRSCYRTNTPAVYPHSPIPFHPQPMLPPKKKKFWAAEFNMEISLSLVSENLEKTLIYSQ